jgi:hypothetical protein
MDEIVAEWYEVFREFMDVNEFCEQKGINPERFKLHPTVEKHFRLAKWLQTWKDSNCPDPETFCEEKGVDFAEFSQLPDVKDELDTIEYLKKKAEAKAQD